MFRKRNKLATLTLNALLFSGSLFLCFFCAEIILRFTGFKYLVYHSEIPGNYFRADEASGYDISNNFPPYKYHFSEGSFLIWSNELGCFDMPYKGDKNYIYLTGDSFTWGFAPYKYKFGTIIENTIGYRCLKCGVTGFGTKQELLKAKKIIKIIKNHPKLIIIGYCLGNDFSDDYIFPNYTVVNGFLTDTEKLAKYVSGKTKKNGDDKINFFVKLKLWMGKRSIIYNLLRDNSFLKSLTNKMGLSNDIPPWLEQGWQDHLNNLRELKIFSAENNAKLLVVIIPPRGLVYDFLTRRPIDSQLKELNYKLKGFFENEKIDYFDLTLPFRKYSNQQQRKDLSSSKDLYWNYDAHWNIKGNELAGLLISEYIIDNNLIEIADKELKAKRIREEIGNFEKE